jgi:hypothetical protein
MHRTQISLEDKQYEQLTQEARRLGISLSALLRRLVGEYFVRRPEPKDPLDRLTGIAEGSGEPVGREHNRYLYEQPPE